MGAVTTSAIGAVDVLACDWNGTLVDDRERAYAATCAVIAHHGGSLPALEDFLADFRLPLRSLLAHYGIVDGVASAIDQWNGVMAQFPARSMPGAEAMLSALASQGTPVAVVSAASAAVLERDMAQLGLDEYVGSVFPLADPKRVALLELRDRYGPVVAFVGDTEYDVAEAQAAGAISVGFSGGYRPRKALIAAGADRVIGELDELIPTLFLIDGRAFSRDRGEERGVVAKD